MACQGEGRRSLLKASRVHLTKTSRSQKEGAAQSHLGENSRQGPQAPPLLHVLSMGCREQELACHRAGTGTLEWEAEGSVLAGRSHQL